MNATRHEEGGAMTFKHEHSVTVRFDSTTMAFFAGAMALLRQLRTGQETIMGEFTTVDAMLTDIRVSTDANAASVAAQGAKIDTASVRLQALVDLLKQSSGMTGAELDALAAKAAAIKADIDAASTGLDDEVAKLEATGVDPNNPTP